MNTDDAQALDAIRAVALPLTGGSDDHAALLELIADAHVVLLGEASHGTHEFYRERARITQRLIGAKGFDAVAVEGDWPDAYRVNRFVRGRGDDAFAVDALAGFRRFPTWMWRNTDVVEFIDWLRAFNATRTPAQRTGFYGLDLYSLHSSMDAVLRYFDRTDPRAAQRARERYACFDRFGPDSSLYGMLTGLRGMRGCEDEVIEIANRPHDRLGDEIDRKKKVCDPAAEEDLVLSGDAGVVGETPQQNECVGDEEQQIAGLFGRLAAALQIGMDTLAQPVVKTNGALFRHFFKLCSQIFHGTLP